MYSLFGMLNIKVLLLGLKSVNTSFIAVLCLLLNEVNVSSKLVKVIESASNLNSIIKFKLLFVKLKVKGIVSVLFESRNKEFSLKDFKGKELDISIALFSPNKCMFWINFKG